VAATNPAMSPMTPPPSATTGVERNYGYMFQWWAMAAAALGFGLYAARRAAKKSAGA